MNQVCRTIIVVLATIPFVGVVQASQHSICKKAAEGSACDVELSERIKEWASTEIVLLRDSVASYDRYIAAFRDAIPYEQELKEFNTLYSVDELPKVVKHGSLSEIIKKHCGEKLEVDRLSSKKEIIQAYRNTVIAYHAIASEEAWDVRAMNVAVMVEAGKALQSCIEKQCVFLEKVSEKEAFNYYCAAKQDVNNLCARLKEKEALLGQLAQKRCFIEVVHKKYDLSAASKVYVKSKL